MSHNLFGERFYSLRAPAWHRIGTISQEEASAAEALSTIGEYHVRVEPLTCASGAELPYHVILRDPTPDDPETRVFGIVGPEYRLVTPERAALVWDNAVQKSVETLGALGRGETLFISMKLPGFDVRGDEVECYLLLVNPLTGNVAAEVRVSPIRVVCQNTLVLAKTLSSEVYRIIHDEQVEERMSAWLQGVYERSMARAEGLREVFQILAQTQISPPQVEEALREIYPEPTPLKLDAPEDVLESREIWRQQSRDSQLRSRQAVGALFSGEGRGMDHLACQGTVWGLYNSVVEWEDYRRTTNPASAAAASLFGLRARVKERAFEVCHRFSFSTN